MAGTGGARKGRDIRSLKDQWMPLTEPLEVVGEHGLDNQRFLGDLLTKLADKNLHAAIIYDVYGRMVLWRKIYAADLIDQRGKLLTRDHPWSKWMFLSAKTHLELRKGETIKTEGGK